jgi:hypothetical protein
MRGKFFAIQSAAADRQRPASATPLTTPDGSQPGGSSAHRRATRPAPGGAAARPPFGRAAAVNSGGVVV